MGKKEKDDKKNNNSSTYRDIAHFSHIGLSMVASIVIGVFIGRHLDRILDTDPWLLIVFSLLGVGGAFIRLFAISKDKD